ncbi:hypothetical protein FE257_006951 [Aspergillus nanangensis]|uniref:Uncharacterized protein n=1 Tax=Aspergillus nanangensis TaxID=2582783 RepID=A0AAD4CNQ8_ASPNN|nr:hypothetical protein FE257_006951 [Aspergillus nanangensis]
MSTPQTNPQTNPPIETNIAVPPHILTLLTNWHRANGTTTKPEFATFLCGDIAKSKAYNRRGVELPLSIIKVYRPCQYEIMLLGTPTPELVSDYQPRYTKTPNMFLVGWPSFDRGPNHCHAVRIVGPHYQYHQEDWDSLDTGYLHLGNQETTTPTPTTTATALPETDAAPVPAPTPAPPIYQHPTPQQPYRPDDGMDCEEPPAKRHKPEQPIPKSTCEVYIRMVYYRVDGESFSYSFPLENCTSVAQLFDKARRFFPFQLRPLKFVIPGDGPREVYEGREGEFESLVRRVEAVKVTLKTAMYVEVKIKVEE